MRLDEKGGYGAGGSVHILFFLLNFNLLFAFIYNHLHFNSFIS